MAFDFHLSDLTVWRVKEVGAMASIQADGRPRGTPSPARPGAHQALAVAVIHQAFEDLMAGSARAASEAARFFTPASPDLRFWAAVAGIDPALAAERAWVLWHLGASARRCA